MRALQLKYPGKNHVLFPSGTAMKKKSTSMSKMCGIGEDEYHLEAEDI